MNDREEIATFGGGCFWCTEAIFKRLKGVLSVVPGFAGGYKENPTWEEVCFGKTGHAESVQIKFDPTQISFEVILEVFFNTHDPTSLNRQDYDSGTAYRSIIFYHDQTQKDVAESVKARLESSGLYKDPIVTEITAFKAFHPADKYHLNFYESGNRPDYCYYVIDPKLRKLSQNYGHLLKEGHE